MSVLASEESALRDTTLDNIVECVEVQHMVVVEVSVFLVCEEEEVVVEEER